MAAPLLVAKGAGELAEQMKAMARRHRVPIVENRTLARALFARGEVEQKIPDEFFASVARLLVWVYALRGPAAGQGRPA
jgi:flagellar biosynthetic protein FlhB